MRRALLGRTKPLGAIATILDEVERSTIDAATGEYVAALHTQSVQEVIRTVRERDVRAVLLSPRCVSRADVSDVARLAQEFPGVPLVAVLSAHAGDLSERLLQLGSSGVHTMVDLTRRDGWKRLRMMVGRDVSTASNQIVAATFAALEAPTLGSERFFETLVVRAPRTASAGALIARFDVPASTLISRFFRAGLPSPKRYLSTVRLVYAASLMRVEGLSLGDVANRLEFSSPQSFSRHIRTATGMTGTEFRERVTFRSALRDFTGRLVLPFRATFRTFHPF